MLQLFFTLQINITTQLAATGAVNWSQHLSFTYIVQIHLTHKLSCFRAIAHACFPTTAWFQSRKFLNPNPPWDLGWHNFSQATEPDLQSSKLPNHKKDLHIEFILLGTTLGKRNIWDQDTHILMSTELTSWALPANDKCLELQVFTLVAILSMRKSRSLAFNFQGLTRTPRYLKGREPMSKAEISVRTLTCWSERRFLGVDN